RNNWVPVSGRLQGIIDRNDKAAAASFSLGRVTMQEGIIEYRGQSGARWQLTSLNGTLDWPTLQSAASTQFTAVWRGEIITVDATLDAPFSIITGGPSPTRFSIDAKPLVLRYEGTAEGSAFTAMNGALSLETPSLRRLAAWLDRREDIADRLGKVALTAKLSRMAGEYTLDEAALTINEDRASGRLQIVDAPGANLKISGTLAFEALTLPTANDLIGTPLAPASATADDTNTNTADTPSLNFTFLETIDLDLRVSAGTAQNEALQLTNLAATLLVNEGRGILDIGTADALDGTVSGVVAVEPELPHSFSLDMRFRDVALDRLAAFGGVTSLSVLGKGNARFKLNAAAPHLRDLAANLNGEGTIDAETGTLTGVDLASIAAASADTPEDQTIFSGDTPFDVLRVGFFISKGTVFLRDTAVSGSGYTATLSGKADLARKTVAFRGNVTRLEPEENPAEVVPFFIGGIADAPLFAPLPRRLAVPKSEPEPPAAPSATPSDGQSKDAQGSVTQ
ncbi:MAG: AsmA-like C-terminal region-containing protein, partial [Pseudomonadota bacterium]